MREGENPRRHDRRVPAGLSRATCQKWQVRSEKLRAASARETDLAFAAVSLAQDGGAIKELAPLGKPVRLQATVSGGPRNVIFRLVSMGADLLQDIQLAPEEGDAGTSRTYAADVTLPRTEFRVLMTGVDANGFPFLRVTPQLFLGGR